MRTEGAALHAAVKAGQDALRRGATSEEAVAAIHAAGAESMGYLWEDTAASLIAESEVVGNRTARFGTSEERATLAEIAAEVSGLTRGERTDGACSDQLSAVICRPPWPSPSASARGAHTYGITVLFPHLG